MLDLHSRRVVAWAAREIRRSMSRKGDCWDNSAAESFFAILRAELVDDERYARAKSRCVASATTSTTSTTSSGATRTPATSTLSSSNCDQLFNSVRHSQPVHGNGDLHANYSLR